nr:MAG TPA: ssDNA binding protein [Bacteriophage sp.]
MNEENEQMNDNTANETAQNIADNYRYICTMDNSTFEGKRAIVNARNNALSLNGYGAKPLTVVGAYIVPGVRSQTGQKCANVYLFGKDGKTYFSQSQGIYRSVLDIYDMFSDFNAPDGITVVVKQTPLGGGRFTKSLEIK